jgi:predicted amidohydrolase YtcJ
MNTRYIIILASLLLGLSSLQAQTGTTILYNGRIWTANPAQPLADAIAMKDGKVLAIGDRATVTAAASSAAGWKNEIDLEGKSVLPGLIDSHIHALGGGADLGLPNLVDEVYTLPRLQRYLDSCSKVSSMMSGDVLYAVGANITTWSDLASLGRMLDSGTLGNQPILLEGSDGHTCYANGAYKKKAGLDKAYILSLPVPSRHFYNLLSDGTPTGFAADSGMGKLFRVLPKTHGKDTTALQQALDYLHSVGVTAFLDPHIGETGKDMENPDLETYALMSRSGRLSAHVAGVVMASGNVDPAPQIATVKALQKKYAGTPDFSLIGFKIFADGVVEYPTQTAALSKPYKNSGYRGDLLYDPKKFKAFVVAADKAGLVVHTHAIGDRAVTETLDAIDAARKANGPNGPLHSITHLQFVLPSDIPRFKALHVPASVQLLWAFGDETTIDIVKPYIDGSIYKWQYPAKSMLDAGALLCGASDWPVSSANPFQAISRAETRQGGKGVLDPAQRVNRSEMFRAYTANAAILMGIQDRAGMLKPGFSADLIVLDRDVWTVSPEDLWNTRVLWTVFEGQLVHAVK